ncbi:UNKNOWN [Stylonychia lemnae]|uniref:Uncharacterized protein n=1 Tax=Stylonychia lemnae TaxID=5949 RepID=A0A078A615_STYLE|nr:UNKNOWN [Stylonychia lemnae]|eukprot:CDW77690.1 UNKNOWN [Stylonychia lemnae]
MEYRQSAQQQKTKDANELTGKPSNQIWFSDDKGRYFLIDGNGKKVKCNNGGQLLPKYNPQLTGYATFNQRTDFLNTITVEDKDAESQELVLSPTQSLKFLHEPPKNTYLPSLNKFEGYTQFRMPLMKRQELIDQNSKNQQKEQSNKVYNLPRKAGKSKQRNITKDRSGQMFQTLPTIIDDPRQEIFSEGGRIQNEDENYSKSPIDREGKLLNRKNISGLYKSYKNQSSKPVDYFQQTRQYQQTTENANRVLEQYGNYLSQSISGKLRRNFQTSPSVATFNDTRSSTDLIRESALSALNEKSLARESQKKIAEISLKIISHQDNQQDMRSPPTITLKKNSSQPGRIMNRRKSNDPFRRDKSKEDTISKINRSPDSRLQMSGSINNFATLFSSQKILGGSLNSQQQSQDMTMQTSQQNDNPERYSSLRYKNYSDLKTIKQLGQTIQDYQQLRAKNKDKITGFMISSPRQEFEKELQQDNMRILLQEDNENLGQFSGMNQREYMGRSISPKIKSVLDFNNPFNLVQLPDTKEDHLQRLRELAELKKSTTGLFNDSIERMRDPGEHWKIDRLQILYSNPHAQMILKKQENFELQKAKRKKQQKKLQAMAIEQDIKTEERKIYKKFVKY